ncbi:response regulator [Pseudoalteromonas aurantia]|uniref:Two-component system response regulator n=1 Tax=Pseudoalteromonas aurantia TaxID=43654 RepID=A0A5S3V7W5_9GAMM|nr:response regulator [Pseudoalteromonas aurantia]TMO56869.1 two-component system response regulator [Pseudoalteromonas aurantia]TMO67921.1 two-component system response regulator [Pseudoalteromonas aurantia]TMO73794.1 two-component system response regulator [Pseudoalteromonas aurantia]
MKHDLNVLLVEDDDIDFMSIVRSFKKRKILNKITRAIDGVHALELLREETITKPFIVLLDLQMPRMSGLEFLDTIRNDDMLNDMVIFVLTTSDNEQDIVKSYKKHVAGYFLKDRVSDQFLDVVDVLDGYWRILQLPKG